MLAVLINNCPFSTALSFLTLLITSLIPFSGSLALGRFSTATREWAKHQLLNKVSQKRPAEQSGLTFLGASLDTAFRSQEIYISSSHCSCRSIILISLLNTPEHIKN